MSGTRRANGEGTIYRPANRAGAWRGSITLPDRKRRVVSGKTRAQASAKLAELRRQQAAGLTLSKRPTVGEFFDAWMPVHVASVRETTAERDQRSCRLYFGPLLDVRLADLRFSHIDRWMEAMTAAGKGAHTVRLCRALLRTGLNAGLRQGLVVRNEATLATPPRVPPPDPGYLDAVQVRAVLNAADGDPLAVGLYLMAYLGLRRGEALGLSWADVDLDARTLYVRRNLVRVPNPVGGWRLMLSEPKTAKSRRHLGIPTPLGDILAAHRRDQQRLALLFALPRPGPDSPVVATRDGGRVDPDNFTKWVARMGKSAGIPGVHPHLLRHSLATLLLSEGVGIETIADVLGHSSVVLTASTYAKVLDAGKSAALDRGAVALAQPVRRGA